MEFKEKIIQNKVIIIIVLVASLVVIIGGYNILKNNKIQEKNIISTITDEEARDTKRLANMVSIREALENYAKENKGFYPKTAGIEKISDGKSSSFLALQKGNYISNPYSDPLADKYYYGYGSDGITYELTAVLERQKDKCKQQGDICIYKISGSQKVTRKEDEDSEINITDIDGNIYNTVQIGSQLWLKQNLKVTRNPQGKKITRYCYNNNIDICNSDGGLYDWNTAMNGYTKEGAQGLCPNGWHIPKDSEWYALESSLSTGACLNNRNVIPDGRNAWSCDPAGAKLKEGGETGFEGIIAGMYDNGHFNDRGGDAYFWSSTWNKNEKYSGAWVRSLYSSYSTIYRSVHDVKSGYSIRCLKD